jgi:hypothetical protein
MRHARWAEYVGTQPGTARALTGRILRFFQMLTDWDHELSDALRRSFGEPIDIAVYLFTASVAFGNQRPIDILLEGKREQVIAHLIRVEHSVYT